MPIMRVSNLIDLLSKVHDSDAVVRIDGHDFIGVEVLHIDEIEKQWLSNRHGNDASNEVRFVKKRSDFSLDPKQRILLEDN